MQIFIRIITGKTIILNLESSDTVASVKQKIQDQVDIDQCQQRLVFQKKQLVDKQNLSHYKVTDDETIYLIPFQYK